MAAFGYGGTSYGGGGGNGYSSYGHTYDAFPLVSPDHLRGMRLNDAYDIGNYVVITLYNGDRVRMYKDDFRHAERLGYFSPSPKEEYRMRILGDWNPVDAQQAPAPKAPSPVKSEPKKPERNVLKELYFRKRLHKK